MRDHFNPASVEVAWCPFVAFRIAIKNGELKAVDSQWGRSRLALWPRSPCFGPFGMRRKRGFKRQR